MESPPTLPNSRDYLRHIAYDSVVFGFSDNTLKILIMEYHNTHYFALPGGFVKRDENLDDAVKRGLKERTGLKNLFLEQFYTFGDCERYNPEIKKELLEASGFSIPEEAHWMLDRFVTIAYYALIDHRNVTPTPDDLSDSLAWHPVNKLPPLILDHEMIVGKALETLRRDLDRKIVGRNLMPPKFTMKELQRVHEAILGHPLQRTNFQRKMLNMGILRRHEKYFTGKSHKAPYLYSFVEGKD